MKVVCNQDWDAMALTINGRYCDVCRKEVIDFTRKSIDSINKIEGELCGRFLPEQVEEGLIPIEFPFFSKIKYHLATLATVIGLDAYAGSPYKYKPEIKTEIAPVDSLKKPEECVVMDIDSIPETTTEVRDRPFYRKYKSFMSIGDRKFYMTKQFPFLRSHKRRYRMGAKF